MPFVVFLLSFALSEQRKQMNHQNHHGGERQRHQQVMREHHNDRPGHNNRNSEFSGDRRNKNSRNKNSRNNGRKSNMRHNNVCGRCGANAYCRKGYCVCKIGFEGDGLRCEKVHSQDFKSFFISEMSNIKNIIIAVVMIVIIFGAIYFIFTMCKRKMDGTNILSYRKYENTHFPFILNKKFNVKEEQEKGFDVRFDPISSK